MSSPETRIQREPGCSHVFDICVASAHRTGLGSAPGSSAWKIGSFGGCANDDAVALDDSKDREESFRSRVGPYAGGESPATALAAPPDPIYCFAPHAANRSPTQGPPGEPPHGLRSDDGVAGAERLVASRHATVGKTARERPERRWR